MKPHLLPKLLLLPKPQPPPLMPPLPPIVKQMPPLRLTYHILSRLQHLPT
jgi:hypothetical protein